MIYLDNSATTAPTKEVIKAVADTMEGCFGNPSSRHFLGTEAEKLLTDCRKRTAKALGVLPEEIYFTSGGTESDNIAVFGGANIKKGKRVITTAVEHPAVLRCMERLEEQGFEVIYLMPGPDGVVPLSAFREAITEQTCLVSVMAVNNETGAIMPVDKIKGIMEKKAPRALLHTDAVQAFGHVPLNLRRWGIDAASISGHKIHGPKGIGILYVKKGTVLKSPVCGGGQEKGLRSGTENLPAIAGLTVAAEQAALNQNHPFELKALLKEKLLSIPHTCHNGGENESPYILNISFGGIRSEVMLNALNEKGICVSAGSACSSSKGGGSHVLKAMKAEMADNAVRFSLSRFTSREEIEEAAAAALEAVRLWRR